MFEDPVEGGSIQPFRMELHAGDGKGGGFDALDYSVGGGGADAEARRKVFDGLVVGRIDTK